MLAAEQVAFGGISDEVGYITIRQTRHWITSLVGEIPRIPIGTEQMIIGGS